ncbi:SAM-dependent methyltransferase [Streptomyces sp. NPDC021093]|uniref:SAM-dependent methyltransferase n=1 Tax=Streptomyces sp. NPDC021093 TaxID=3365112 RepID=UPI00378DA904
MTSSIDVNVPSVARMYDYLLDGKDSYPADQQACEELLKTVPSMKALALNNREFLRRVVRTLAQDYGIRQFVDHGSGLPTRDNVHQVAQAVHEDARVVYIDDDPIVLAHGRALLQEDLSTTVIQADMRDTDAIFDHPETQRLIRPDEPTAALFVSVMHCIPDHEENGPAQVLERVKARLAPGSFLVVCQLVSPRPDIRDSVTEFMRESTGDHWGRVREEADVEGYLHGLEIVPPGLVEVSQWRRDNDLLPRQESFEWSEFGGVARLP